MVIQKEIVIESFAVTDMTTVASAVLFRSESKGSGFHANERPQKRFRQSFTRFLQSDSFLEVLKILTEQSKET